MGVASQAALSCWVGWGTHAHVRVFGTRGEANNENTVSLPEKAWRHEKAALKILAAYLGGAFISSGKHTVNIPYSSRRRQLLGSGAALAGVLYYYLACGGENTIYQAGCCALALSYQRENASLAGVAAARQRRARTRTAMAAWQLYRVLWRRDALVRRAQTPRV